MTESLLARRKVVTEDFFPIMELEERGNIDNLSHDHLLRDVAIGIDKNIQEAHDEKHGQ